MARLGGITFLLLVVLSAAAPLASEWTCSPGVIPHSNVTAERPCHGGNGTVCPYTCDPGYWPVGRHVCQYYQAGGTVWIDRQFFGGRCDRLCDGQAQSCKAPAVPVRFNGTDESGPCLEVENSVFLADYRMAWLCHSCLALAILEHAEKMLIFSTLLL